MKALWIGWEERLKKQSLLQNFKKFKKIANKKKWTKQAKIIGALYIEPLASHEPTIEDFRAFKQQKQSIKLKEEW